MCAVTVAARMDAVDKFDPLRCRPNTPVEVVWYDFLLDDGLLERHLNQENPDPSALHSLLMYQNPRVVRLKGGGWTE